MAMVPPAWLKYFGASLLEFFLPRMCLFCGVPVGETAVVAVCPDHQTPSAGPLYHGGGAVPLLIAGGVAGADSVTAYGETACASGALGTLRGIDVLPLALDAADRTAFLADRITGHLALGMPQPEDLRPLKARG